MIAHQEDEFINNVVREDDAPRVPICKVDNSRR